MFVGISHPNLNHFAKTSFLNFFRAFWHYSLLIQFDTMLFKFIAVAQKNPSLLGVQKRGYISKVPPKPEVSNPSGPSFSQTNLIFLPWSKIFSDH